MIRNALILASLLGLGGCVALPSFHLPKMADKAAPEAPLAAAPRVCPASITSDIAALPSVPDDAQLPAIEVGAPQPLQDGFRSYTGWLHSYADVAKGYGERLTDAQKWCAGLK